MPDTEEVPGPTAPAPAAEERRATILVVDDEAALRTILRSLLEPHYTVFEACDGLDAIQVFARERIDLVLLDLRMPRMDGLAACRAIKAQATGGFVPVLILTAFHEQQRRNEGLSEGADDVILKPVDRRELLLRVRAFLRLRWQEEQIRRQLDDMRRLQAEKDDLFSFVMHDLMNPLQGIQGYLEMLERLTAEPAHAECRPHVEGAADNAAKLRDLLDDVLEVRRLEAGKAPIRREPASVRALVHDAAATVRGAAESSGVAIALAVEGDPRASLDFKRVRRAIENLIVNALHYSPEGAAVDVAVRAPAPEAGHAPEVEIEIADRGPGLSRPVKEALFQKFASGGAGSGKRRGFGLGLHFVSLVAAAHGGTVRALDRDGGGAVFRLRLPLMADAAPAAP